MRKALLFIAILALLAPPSHAGQVPDAEYIHVTAEVSIQVQPDVAHLRLDLDHTDMDATIAKANVDARSAKVIEIARNLGINHVDVTASHISINPDYDWGERRKQTYKGTMVSREIELTLRDLSKYSILIQKLSEVPITSLCQVRMASSKMEEHQDEAYSQAADKARSKAEKIARQFGVELGQVYSISDTEIPFFGGPIMVAAMSSSTEFEPGTIEIEARIYAVFRLQIPK